MAVGIPRFELCLALVGSLTTTVLAFILPPLFHLKLMWRHVDLKRNIFHIALLVTGIFVTVGATAVNLYMAINGGSNGPKCADFKKPGEYIDKYAHCFTVLNNKN